MLAAWCWRGPWTTLWSSDSAWRLFVFVLVSYVGVSQNSAHLQVVCFHFLSKSLKPTKRGNPSLRQSHVRPHVFLSRRSFQCPVPRSCGASPLSWRMKRMGTAWWRCRRGSWKKSAVSTRTAPPASASAAHDVKRGPGAGAREKGRPSVGFLAGRRSRFPWPEGESMSFSSSRKVFVDRIARIMWALCPKWQI